MNKQESFFQRVGRASVVAKTYPEDFAKGTAAGDGVTALGEARQQYVALKSEAGSIGLLVSMGEQAEIRDDFEAVMDTVYKLSKGMAISAVFMPTERSMEALVSAARMWLKEDAVQAKFAQHGYSHYLDELRDRVVKVTAAVDARQARQNMRTQAGNAIKQLYRSTRQLFRQVDAVVRLQLRDNPPILAVWLRATDGVRKRTKRVSESVESTGKTVEPTRETVEPVSETATPSPESVDPSSKTVEPVSETVEPTSDTAEPVTDSSVTVEQSALAAP